MVHVLLRIVKLLELVKLYFSPKIIFWCKFTRSKQDLCLKHKGLVIINTRDRGERKYNFFLKKIHNPSKFRFKFSYSIRKSSKNFITQHVEAFYVLIVFTIFTNPIKNRFKDKQLTATYNLIALNLNESSHIIHVQYSRG